MCLITLKTKNIQIAKLPITVYKRCLAYKKNDGWVAESIIQDGEYKFNQTMETVKLQVANYKQGHSKFHDIIAFRSMQSTLSFKSKKIQEDIAGALDVYSIGYHSFKTPYRDQAFGRTLHSDLKSARRILIEFTIPIGSEYISDLSGLLVSSDIILTDKRFKAKENE